MDETTDLFGIPIPSADRAFLIIVAIHIAIALVAVISGLLAMLIDKTLKRHSGYGRVYFWSVLSSFIAVLFLSLMRWPHNNHLLLIGSFATAFTYTGYKLSKHKRRSWTRLHTVYMGLSYILLLTGFYVDNGKNLPFWNRFPQWFFWLFPTIVGIPLIIFALIRHPLNKKNV